MKWPGETCDCCTREQRLAWSVSDNLWMRVVIAYYYKSVLCLECFLRMAENRGITIDKSDIEFYAVVLNIQEAQSKKCPS